MQQKPRIVGRILYILANLSHHQDRLVDPCLGKTVGPGPLLFPGSPSRPVLTLMCADYLPKDDSNQGTADALRFRLFSLSRIARASLCNIAALMLQESAGPAGSGPEIRLIKLREPRLGYGVQLQSSDPEAPSRNAGKLIPWSRRSHGPAGSTTYKNIVAYILREEDRRG